MKRTSINRNQISNAWAWISGLAATVILLSQDARAVQTPVALGSASTYRVLAATTVTSTGATVVNGDLGLSPGTAVTGFPPGIVNGVTHVADAAAAQAQLDLTTAYNDAAGRTVGAITVAGNLGGQILVPGLYKSSSSLAISSGDLTLDAQGDPNAVWIFQMGSTLDTTVGRQVILSGGARAENVFWQVGSSATIGVGSVFKGTIMANVSITLATGATLDGRALARTGAVTLDGNANPTLATVVSFTGHWEVDRVKLAWTSVAEFWTLGYNVYAGQPDGKLRQVNTDWVFGSGNPLGGSYELDDAIVRPPAAVTYWLEEVDYTLKSSWFDPIVVVVPSPAVVAGARMTSGGMELTFTGEVGREYEVQVADELAGGVWETLTTAVIEAGSRLQAVTVAEGRFTVVDPAALGKPTRFYRALSR